jgi:ABC-type multidrug transport system ATPase subunit
MSTDRLAGAERLGYLPENGPLYPDMTPRSLLEFFADARGLSRSRREERIEAVVRQCELGSVIGKAIGKLSKGFRQRVGMAQVLLHEPDVLILDEPTSGLDPNQIREVRETIRRLGERKTILLSTHILQEVEALADRVILIAEGRLRFDGTPAELRSEGRNLDEAREMAAEALQILLQELLELRGQHEAESGEDGAGGQRLIGHPRSTGRASRGGTLGIATATACRQGLRFRKGNQMKRATQGSGRRGGEAQRLAHASRRSAVGGVDRHGYTSVGPPACSPRL